MRIESKLCHISEKKAVVQVNGWLNDKNLGSAMAEGATVEVAEDKAISRLNQRINAVNNIDASKKSIKENNIKTPLKVELANNEKTSDINVNYEPSDWSNELTAIDSEIRRLNWSRDDEIDFLEINFGYNNRNKITKYSDILQYLNLLKKTNKQDKSKLPKVNIDSLIEESDVILRELSWNHIQGREYLQKEFNVLTRKELNEEQLISFVDKLKSIRNHYPPQ